MRTSFQDLEIWKSKLATEFRVAGAIHASHHRTRYLTGLAWDLIAASALLRPSGPPASLLMLGLAGGTSLRILRHLLPGCRFTAVDIDGEIIDLAHKHMALGEVDIDIRIGDAYEWLKNNRERFDVVIDDIYLAGKTDVFRSREWDPALLGHLRRAVAPGGLLSVNLVTGQGHRAMQSATRRILRENFDDIRTLCTEESMNEVLVAGERIEGIRALASHLPAFSDWRDRMYWKRIKLRRLQ